MAIPHQFIGTGQTAHSLECSKCGRPCAAVHHGGRCSQCFDFEKERKRALEYEPKQKNDAQKAKMRERSKEAYEKRKKELARRAAHKKKGLAKG